MLTVHRSFSDSSQTDNWIGPAPWITSPPPGPMALWAVARGRRVAPLSNTKTYPLVARRAQGTIVEDVDRNRYLDFTAGLAVCSVGHCHPQVAHAIEHQAGNLVHTCGSEFYHGPMIELAEKLAKIAPGDEAKSVLLTNSAAVSVKTAIKMARWHTQRKTSL